MTYIDEELEAEAIHTLKDVEHMFVRAIEKEKENERIQSLLSPHVLSKYLITVWCRLNTLIRMYPEHKILSEQIKMQLPVVG
jgi:TetR/AcrR family transcriptional repressor of nem operon